MTSSSSSQQISPNHFVSSHRHHQGFLRGPPRPFFVVGKPLIFVVGETPYFRWSYHQSIIVVVVSSWSSFLEIVNEYEGDKCINNNNFIFLFFFLVLILMNEWLFGKNILFRKFRMNSNTNRRCRVFLHSENNYSAAFEGSTLLPNIQLFSTFRKSVWSTN